MREEEEEEEEEEPNWFVLWEEDLPKPEELMPLSQSLITSDLALAFDIPTPNPNPNQSLPPDLDDSARTLKRPRLVWTPQLHKRFVDAVAHLGIKNAVPKTIMHLMTVDGLTRENVASHLQKYRLYLKRMQGLAPADAALEQLFSSNHIQRQDSFLQFVAPPMLPRNHHQQQQYYHQIQMGLFGSMGPATGLHRMVRPAYDDDDDDDYDDVDLRVGGGRRVLTLFPTCGQD